MEDRKMDAVQVLEETSKIIGNIRLPVVFCDENAILAGCLKNIAIAIEMIKKEREVRKDEADSE